MRRASDSEDSRGRLVAAPQAVIDLVERFERNLEQYRSPSYNETQLRREFLDPLFKALGWDIDNEQGYAEAYKDVVHEDSIEVDGGAKAPDYAFRVGGRRMFFLEAKKPAVNVKTDIAPSYQVRRYGWSAKLPISILSDFEELAVYDTRVKPAATDKASTARVAFWTHRDYVDRWDEIADIFSRDAVLKGSFDRYVADSKRKKGTAEVDEAFLKEIEGWRETLARNIALRNPDISTKDLNFAVQRTIDRIIFLRICEARGIEDEGLLREAARERGVHKSLVQLFERADDRYNSGIFHFKREKGRSDESLDTLTPHLKIDDKILKDILQGLYYPHCPYEFSVLPADILGQVYEQFLGKVIRLTAGHQAKIEEKLEVRKAGGVYYTPSYVVDYIVEQTVGELLKSKTPRSAAKLRIVDPACGSGSFLIVAYQRLLDWHLEQYVDDGPEKHRKQLYQGPHGEWRLTTEERKRILLNNIYGVDIDPQAVEVTKLSLALKVLEGETAETLGRTLQLLADRALPDLDSNIKCGNSLIGPDFYEQQERLFLAEEELERVNVFDWDMAFPAVFEAGGFDVVIGNPPYGIPFTASESEYLLSHYQQTAKSPDSYCMFMVAGSRIARPSGLVSMIVPNTFCDLESCDVFRQWLLDHVTLEAIWQSGWAFKDAVVDTLVFRVANTTSGRDAVVDITVDGRQYTRQTNSFEENGLRKIDYRNTAEDVEVLDVVMDSSRPLAEYCSVKAGVKLYEKGKGTPPQTAETLKRRPFTSDIAQSGHPWRSLYRGKHVRRLTLSEPDEWVQYGPWLAAPRDASLFEGPKVLMRRTDWHLYAAVDDTDSICVNSCHVLKLHSGIEADYGLLSSLLNSKLLQKVFEIQNPQMVEKVFAEIKVIYVERLPVPELDRIPSEQVKQLAALRDRQVELGHMLESAGADQDRLKRLLQATEDAHEKMVRALYGL